MKINFKINMSIIAVSCALLFQACGGGGASGSGGDGGGSGPVDRTDIGGVNGNFKYDRVTIAGSSITYGGMGDQGGLLGERSYVGEVEKYLREEVADTKNPTELKALNPDGSSIIELLSYQGELVSYGAGSTITGTLKASDEVVIVYGGSGTDTTVEMSVDGKVCGTKTISGSFKPEIIEHEGSGMDPNLGTVTVESFRRTNDDAVATICTGLENKQHNFTLTVKSGVLNLNFITNHMYYMQNAGIGGYRASDLLKEKAKNSLTTTDQIVEFKPDLFILESSTNDVQPWGKEDGTSTNKWKIETPTSCIVNANQISGLNLSGISAGDVVVIGTYNGDMKNMASGIVSKTHDGNITLDRNIINYGNTPMSGTTECRVKSISTWVDDVKEVVKRVKAGSPNALVGIGTNGVPNYWDPTKVPFSRYGIEFNVEKKRTFLGSLRRLLGYKEVGQKLAAANGWMFYDFFTPTLNANSGVDFTHDDKDGNEIRAIWSIGDNTHPNAKGNKLFGKAITDILKQQ